MAPFSTVLTASEAQEVLRKKALGALGELPPFSPILTRVLASLAGNDVSFAALSDLIEKDAVLAGNLLHLVNSALYGRRGTINSVRHSMSILGMDKLRNAILGMSISRMWNSTRMPSSWSMARFNLHSAATATLSDMLAQRLPVTYPEGAFVAGLLHDVGRLLIALGLNDQHDRIQRLSEKGELAPVDCEREVLGFTHPELSGEALGYWSLPDPIQTAVRFHHDPDGDDSKAKPGEIRLSRILDAANQYVNSIGVSILPVANPRESDASLIESLGLEPERLERALAEFKAEFDTMSQFFR
ncbi:MAG: HDOD domain-containing protein [Bryobacteraceae bacterium]|jgi:HD-like signal output (HDOD) protein